MFAGLLAAAMLGSAAGQCSSAAKPMDSKCTGCPPMYNGKLCASTTRYNDQTKGPCGCGDTDTPAREQWTFTQYTAALNAANLNPAKPSVAWCPTGCGSCYRICGTGGTVQGKAAAEGECRVFKISNRCGDGYDSNTPDWCSQRKSWQECAADGESCAAEGTNKYGYAAHFDLMDMHEQITAGLGWDNPEVTFEPVSCSEWDGPSWDCFCDSADGNSSTTSPLTTLPTTSSGVSTTDPSSETTSTTTQSVPTTAPPVPVGFGCGFDCSGGCETCTGFSQQEYCLISQSNCEGNCGGQWCPTREPTTATTTASTTTSDASPTSTTSSATTPTSTVAPGPEEYGCGFDCSGGCETCSSVSHEGYCSSSQSQCEADCGGHWCPNGEHSTTSTSGITTTVSSTTFVPTLPTTTSSHGPVPEGTVYCPSAGDFVVAYGNGVTLQDQGWTVTGDGGAATKAAYNLNGGSVEYDMDVSGARTGTIPNIYSIAPSGLGADGFVKDRDYCDGADQHEYPWCVEVDWIESNGACGGATTLHTVPGTGPDVCNAWGCRTEYHNPSPKFHMRIDYDAAGHMTVTQNGKPLDLLSPSPKAGDYETIRKSHETTGAVIYSSMWTGSWVPGPKDCGAGPADLTGSTFTISNLRIQGAVVQGPEPQKCSPPPAPAACDIYPNHEMQGDVMTATSTASAADCCAHCQEAASCAGWTWGHDTGACQLKSNVGLPRPTSLLMTSGMSKTSTTTTASTTSSTMTSAISSSTTSTTTTTQSSTTSTSSTPTSTSSSFMTTTHITPDWKRCRACNTMCYSCRSCAGSKEGQCGKCWRCWDYDDDEDEDEDSECNALDKDHDWDDDEVQCLSEKVEDCRQCWDDVPLPTTTTTTSAPPSDKQCRACNTMCASCKACADSQSGTCEKCWRCWDYDDDEKEDQDKECHALNKHHDWDDDEVQCLSTEVADCRLCWSMDAFTV